LLFQELSPGSHYTWKAFQDIINSNKTLLGLVESQNNETWSYSEAFYFCWVTTTTVGYGEIVVNESIARFFVQIYALIGVATLSVFIARVSEIKEFAENKLKSAQQIRENNKFNIVIPDNLPEKVHDLLNTTLKSVHDLKPHHKTIFIQQFTLLVQQELKTESTNSNPAFNQNSTEDRGMVELDQPDSTFNQNSDIGILDD